MYNRYDNHEPETIFSGIGRLNFGKDYFYSPQYKFKNRFRKGRSRQETAGYAGGSQANRFPENRCFFKKSYQTGKNIFKRL